MIFNAINRQLTRLPHNRWNQTWGLMATMVLTWPTGEVYLKRWRIIQTPMFGLYLHRIERGDYDDAMHNHPWILSRKTSFWSFVLRGGYTERFAETDDGLTWPVATNVHVAPVLRAFPNGAVHQITHVLANTWTFVVVGRRVSSWEFLDPKTGHLVPWARYLRSVGRDPLGNKAVIPDA